VFVGTLISNILFIALRTQIRHKIQLDRVPEKKQLPDIDTIIAIQEVANAFGAQMIPLVVGLYIYCQPNNTNHPPLYWELKMILFSNLLSAICITYLIFVPWKKGPAWYLKHSHKVFFVLLVTNYLVLPIINNIAFIYFIFLPTVDLKKEAIESYIVFFNVVCFMRIVEYVVIVRRTVWLDAKVYLQMREEEASMSKDELQSLLLDSTGESNADMGMRTVQKEILEEKLDSYLERERGYGQGEVRIGTYMEVGDDIYSLGFISMINDRLMDQHFDIIKGELIDEKTKRKMRKKA